MSKQHFFKTHYFLITFSTERRCRCAVTAHVHIVGATKRVVAVKALPLVKYWPTAFCKHLLLIIQQNKKQSQEENRFHFNKNKKKAFNFFKLKIIGFYIYFIYDFLTNDSFYIYIVLICILVLSINFFIKINMTQKLANLFNLFI